MRKPFSSQRRLDCRTVLDVELNLDCRDEIVPILRALQHIYSQTELRDEVLRFVGQGVNPDSRVDWGREGMDYWQILVLAGVRLGCNLDYDKLQDLAEQHRALRHIMGIGDWQGDINFNWRRIRDNVCLLTPAIIEKISHQIVNAGHELDIEAAKKVRADSFVAQTNTTYPSESPLILDGVRGASWRVRGFVGVVRNGRLETARPSAQEGEEDRTQHPTDQFAQRAAISEAAEEAVSITAQGDEENPSPHTRLV